MIAISKGAFAPQARPKNTRFDVGRGRKAPQAPNFWHFLTLFRDRARDSPTKFQGLGYVHIWATRLTPPPLGFGAEGPEGGGVSHFDMS